MRHAFILVALLSMACQAREDQAESPAPPIDRSAPDRLVESLWRYQAWKYERNQREYMAQPHPEHAAFSADVVKHFAHNDQQALEEAAFPARNKVVSVKLETPTRAVVTASEFQYAGADEPEEIRYVLDHEQEGWVIKDEVQDCSICHGTGKVDDSERQLADMERGQFGTNPQKTCEYCHGRGWRSAIFGD